MTRIPACLAVLLFATACWPGGSARVSSCMAALAGIDTAGGKLAIDGINAESARVAIDYRRDSDDDLHWIVCRYDAPLWGLASSELVGVVIDGTAIGEGRLAFLKSHWIDTRAARREVAERVDVEKARRG